VRALTARMVGVTVVGSLLVVGSTASIASTKHRPAKKPAKHTRIETLTYAAACGAHVGDGPTNVVTAIAPVCLTSGLPQISPAAKTEPFVSLAVKDSTGRPVHGEIWTKAGNGDAQDIEFCGTLPTTSIPPGSYTVTIDAVSLDPSCPSVGTSGTITVKYANYR
jgi:hypothetical protein